MTATKAFLCATMCLLLAACASAPPRPLPSENFDSQKVVLVNQWAEAHGAKLIWVHYPTLDPAKKTD